MNNEEKNKIKETLTLLDISERKQSILLDMFYSAYFRGRTDGIRYSRELLKKRGIL